MSADPTQQTAFRLPLSLLERLDLHAERLRAEQPGLKITRADVVRLLLTRALDALDAAGAPPKSAPGRRR
jgi:predicted DNA-binding protein